MPQQRGLIIKQCAHCNADYLGRKSSKYCSNSCGARGRPKRPANKGSFKPKQKPWNAGADVSGMSGKKHSLATREKMRESSSGELGTNWKGGVTDENYRLRRSRKYADWRGAVFARDNYTCQECGDRSCAGNRVRLNADHIRPFAFYPELRFDISNGRTLCEYCHRKTPTWGAQVDVTGQEATLEGSGETFNALTDKRLAA